jgi:hypothetical protein
MTSSESFYPLELWDKHIGPTCGKTIPEGKYIGSRKKSEGGFCTHGCYAEYYRMEITERAKKVQELAERHRNS